MTDESLAALAFLEAVATGQRANWTAMMDTISEADLLAGLTRVGVDMARSLATLAGHDLTETFEAHRRCYLAAATI